MFNENALKVVKNLITRDNITLLIAVVGLLLSLWNFFKDLWENRSKVRLVFKSCSITKLHGFDLLFGFSFENLSRLPIAVSRIFLKSNDELFEFEWLPHWIFKQGIEGNNNVIYSEKIPNSIEGLGLWGGYFFLSLPKNFNKSDLIGAYNKIIIHTNRGIKRFPIEITEENITSLAKD